MNVDFQHVGPEVARSSSPSNSISNSAKVIPNPKAKLLDQVREVLRVKHYSIRTEQAYVDWIKRYMFFHAKRQPREMGAEQVQAYLSHLAVARSVSASTQNQALNALVFLYREVLHLEMGELDTLVRPGVQNLFQW